MYANVSFDGVPDAELKRPKLKADDDISNIEEALGGDASNTGGDGEEEEGLTRRGLYVFALAVLSFMLFALPSDWTSGGGGGGGSGTPPPPPTTMTTTTSGSGLNPTPEDGGDASANTASSTMIDYARLAGSNVAKKPFTHVVCKNAVAMSTLRSINADFPPSLTSQAHVDEEDLVAAGEIKGKFAALLEELRGAALKKTLEDKFDVSLANTFTRITLRGLTRAAVDGRIHVDDESKKVSVLVYLNEDWPFEGDGGKLRLLKKRNFELGTQGVQAEAFGGDVLAFKNPAGGGARRAACFDP